MAYDYKGTKITGTSTTAKVFRKSGIKNAHVGDTYLNTQKGRYLLKYAKRPRL